jgi:hypothetical protein
VLKRRFDFSAKTNIPRHDTKICREPDRSVRPNFACGDGASLSPHCHQHVTAEIVYLSSVSTVRIASELTNNTHLGLKLNLSRNQH